MLARAEHAPHETVILHRFSIGEQIDCRVIHSVDEFRAWNGTDTSARHRVSTYCIKLFGLGSVRFEA